MPEHGGNLDLAMQRFGGKLRDWIDLSTGINRNPYPVGELPETVWGALPSKSALNALHQAAQQAYGTTAPILATNGAQAAIQLLPHLCARGNARILGPTYNEYTAVFSAAGWDVAEVSDLEALAGADIAILANPNNPDGKRYEPKQLLELLPKVGQLVVDESFVDATPELSLASNAGREGLLILRSFGKFFGLAGLRLGFAIGSDADVSALAAMAGPWPVSGPAIAIGERALRDREWAKATSARLVRDAQRLDAQVLRLGWTLVGGTALFRLYETGDAHAAQEKLARARIWSRVFPYHRGRLRLGLPGNEAEWARLSAALTG
ncbi:threonine-phosphate decarboxylase CobD [Bradyrhizobium sp.]|uniref:threonine-phosphate decarboxylase CobD n=1 Tax=Bradyrhizobium sp. TaxID=376 RepID=UPI002D697390|nr:threonine-phosphate decarboxylase CobD [Bradyrhizobium sp.]HZR71729.1 threonine-phosphate decarboxylase CobD [Bradyrhizobium sp.]